MPRWKGRAVVWTVRRVSGFSRGHRLITKVAMTEKTIQPNLSTTKSLEEPVKN